MHVELPTLLKKQKLGVDVAWAGFSLVMRVNGVQRIRVHDVLAQDGVVHVVDQVLMPPKKLKGSDDDEKIVMSLLRDGIDECKGMLREEL